MQFCKLQTKRFFVALVSMLILLSIKFVMKKIFSCILLLVLLQHVYAQSLNKSYLKPNTNSKGWVNLFDDSLSDAIFIRGIWTFDGGVLTASEDQSIWTKEQYDDFILDLEFKNAEGTNSGVIVHATDINKWVAHSVEIQIADDYSEEWSKALPSWQCGAIFGRQAASQHTVKKAGEWNHYTIICIKRKIWVVLNDVLVNECDMSLYTSATDNIDGTKAPEWLNNPMASLALHGRIGLQGKHAGAPIYFRKMRVKKI